MFDDMLKLSWNHKLYCLIYTFFLSLIVIEYEKHASQVNLITTLTSVSTRLLTFLES